MIQFFRCSYCDKSFSLVKSDVWTDSSRICPFCGCRELVRFYPWKEKEEIKEKNEVK